MSEAAAALLRSACAPLGHEPCVLLAQAPSSRHHACGQPFPCHRNQCTTYRHTSPPPTIPTCANPAPPRPPVLLPADNLVSKLNAQKGASAGDIIREMGWYNLFTRGLPLRIVMIGTLTGLQVRPQRAHALSICVALHAAPAARPRAVRLRRIDCVASVRCGCAHRGVGALAPHGAQRSYLCLSAVSSHALPMHLHLRVSCR